MISLLSQKGNILVKADTVTLDPANSRMVVAKAGGRTVVVGQYKDAVEAAQVFGFIVDAVANGEKFYSMS